MASITVSMPFRLGKTTAMAKAKALQVPELRACALCLHSAGHQPGPQLQCHAPAVSAVHGKAASCSLARASSGACGPDARHMDMQSWKNYFHPKALT